MSIGNLFRKKKKKFCFTEVTFISKNFKKFQNEKLLKCLKRLKMYSGVGETPGTILFQIVRFCLLD